MIRGYSPKYPTQMYLYDKRVLSKVTGVKVCDKREAPKYLNQSYLCDFRVLNKVPGAKEPV